MSKHLKHFLLGTLTGLASPMAGLFIYWLFTWRNMSFTDFFIFMHQHRLVAAHLSLACLVNLPVFYILINKNKYKFAQGVILGTLAYAFYIFYYKLFIAGD